MRKILLAASAAVALLCSLPAYATTTTASGDAAQLGLTATLTAQNDAVQFTSYLGGKWATVRWAVVTAGNGAITVQYSKDGGGNWLSAPSSVNISATSANPSTAPWVGNTPIAGSYETPLPANCTDFRILYSTGGTATQITLLPGVPYVPGTVLATLSDITEGSIGAGIGTSTTALDVSGWTAVQILGISPTTQVVTVRPLDDLGAALGGTLISFAATSSGGLLLSRTGAAAMNTVGAGVYTTAPLATRRIAAYLPAGGTVSVGRIIVQGLR